MAFLHQGIVARPLRSEYSFLTVLIVLLTILVFMKPDMARAQETPLSCPSAVSLLTAGERPDVALKLIDELLETDDTLKDACRADRLAALSALAATKTGPDAGCKEAADLTANGNPAGALDLIEKIRGSEAPTEDHLSVFSFCEKERRQALVGLNSEQAESPPQGICEAVSSLTTANRPESALALVEAIRGPSDSRTLQESSLCEGERVSALRAQAVMEAGSGPAQTVGQNWDTLIRDWVAPSQGAGLLTLALILAWLILARLFSFLPRMPISMLGWRKRSSYLREVTFVTGSALILLSSGLTAQLLVETPFDIQRLPAIWLAALVGIGGSFLLALFIASRLRMMISVTAPEGEPSEWGTSRIVSSLRELGAEPPRGIEVPRGLDVTGLDDAAISIPLTNSVLNALQGVLKAIAGATPWHVTVDKKSDDILVFSISRNGWNVYAGTVSRDQLGLEKITGTDHAPDLYKMVSAAIVATVAPHYEGFEGLCGATDWRSIGLHCIATTEDYSGSKSQASELLGRANNFDGNNITAEIALQYILHREATKRNELERYCDWLLTKISQLEAKTEPGYENLILRTKLTYLACLLNLRALPEVQLAPEELERAGEAANSLLASLEKAAGKSNPLALEMLPHASLAYFDLIYSGVAYENLSQQEQEQDRYQHYHAAIYSTSPKIAYNAACSLAKREDAKQNIPLIRERLTCAFTDLDLRQWALMDPELVFVRQEIADLLPPATQQVPGLWATWTAATLNLLRSLPPGHS